MKRKLMSYLLAAVTLINTVTPALAVTTFTDSTESVEYHEHSEDYTGTTVYAEIGSEFKVTIPKKVTLDGATKQGGYNVLVEGDIAGNEYVKVVPETYFLLYTKDKAPIPATVSQDRTGWSFLDFGTKANGLIETEGMTAGAWNGTFNFNIKLESSMELDSTINGGITNPDDGGEQVTLKVNNVSGVQKEQLLGTLEESGQIENSNDIDAMINITTSNNTLDGIDDITINTTGVANPGDTVVIVQEKEDEWDYVSTETVNTNNEVKISMMSTHPMAFVQTQSDGTVHVHKYEEDIITEATCATNGTLSMICECFKEYNFTIPASHKLEQVEKKDENGELINKYYQCENCAYSILNLTQLFAGNELSHDCNNYIISKYDSINHWNECSVCNKVLNKKLHQLTTYYSMGENSCSTSNLKITTCSCGYSTSVAANIPHKKVTDIKIYTPGYNHYWHCDECGNHTKVDKCQTADGKYINCNNLGTCYICGYKYETIQHSLTLWGNGTMSCGTCGFTAGTISEHKVTNENSILTVSYTFTPATGATTTYDPILGINYYQTGFFEKISHTCKKEGSSYKIETKMKIIATKESTDRLESIVFFPFTNKGYGGNGYRICINTTVYPEKIVPTISEVKQTNVATLNNWSISKQLTFSGTENFCNTVKLTLKDANGNTYLNNVSVPVTNKNWTYTCIPNIEANETGKTFTLTVQDTFGNKATKTFNVSKTDKKAPTINSPAESNKTWSQTKELLFTATDEGSGNVQIAFNNINEYVNMDKNGTTYTKGYQFSGDVYGEIMAAIYYTDAAGNVATQFIKVYNLDNTVPTISNVAVNGKQITVTANDLNSQLNMEGSGISGYALTWTQAPPQDSDWQDSNILNVSTNGTYYIWVKDAVGNISECYQVRIIL